MNKRTANQQQAAALRYKQSQEAAPKVVAKGTGSIARKIMELAQENGVPVLQDQALIEFLMNVEVHDTIPAEAFEAAAQIYSYLIELDDRNEKVAG